MRLQYIYISSRKVYCHNNYYMISFCCNMIHMEFRELENLYINISEKQKMPDGAKQNHNMGMLTKWPSIKAFAARNSFARNAILLWRTVFTSYLKASIWDTGILKQYYSNAAMSIFKHKSKLLLNRNVVCDFCLEHDIYIKWVQEKHNKYNL